MLDQSTVKTLALVGPNVQNIVTKDCGTRKEPSYLGCEGCYWRVFLIFYAKFVIFNAKFIMISQES